MPSDPEDIRTLVGLVNRLSPAEAAIMRRMPGRMDRSVAAALARRTGPPLSLPQLRIVRDAPLERRQSNHRRTMVGFKVYLTMAAACRAMGLSTRTIKEQERRGRLPAHVVILDCDNRTRRAG